jgi:hypothetical protein
MLIHWNILHHKYERHAQLSQAAGGDALAGQLPIDFGISKGDRIHPVDPAAAAAAAAATVVVVVGLYCCWWELVLSSVGGCAVYLLESGVTPVHCALQVCAMGEPWNSLGLSGSIGMGLHGKRSVSAPPVQEHLGLRREEEEEEKVGFTSLHLLLFHATPSAPVQVVQRQLHSKRPFPFFSPLLSPSYCRC